MRKPPPRRSGSSQTADGLAGQAIGRGEDVARRRRHDPQPGHDLANPAAGHGPPGACLVEARGDQARAPDGRIVQPAEPRRAKSRTDRRRRGRRASMARGRQPPRSALASESEQTEPRCDRRGHDSDRSNVTRMISRTPSTSRSISARVLKTCGLARTVPARLRARVQDVRAVEPAGDADAEHVAQRAGDVLLRHAGRVDHEGRERDALLGRRVRGEDAHAGQLAAGCDTR